MSKAHLTLGSTPLADTISGKPPGFPAVNDLPQTAILLAAGSARRLKELTKTQPKCLLEVGGKSLIEHQIDALRHAGVEEIVVVTGYFAEKIEARLGDTIRSVRNEVYDRTNSLYSLSLALPFCRGGVVLTNADVLFHPSLLGRLLHSPHEDALLYEPASHLGDEEMKIRIEDGRVTALAKTLEHGTYHGENLGVLKFGATGVERLREAASRLVDEGQVNAWAPMAFDAICADQPIMAVPIGSLPWVEIDFPEDLERARNQVWPEIQGARAARAAHD